MVKKLSLGGPTFVKKNFECKHSTLSGVQTSNTRITDSSEYQANIFAVLKLLDIHISSQFILIAFKSQKHLKTLNFRESR